MRDANARPAQTPARVMDIYAVVVGSGAAGFNAAHRLRQYGVTDAALVTEGRLWGTSRNTGSDKQTYYKLSLSGSQDDSVRKLAAVGLWECDMSSPDVIRPTMRKKAWEVYKNIDKVSSLETTEFAKEIIGIEKWSDVIPNFKWARYE